jgi:hypothetical protein
VANEPEYGPGLPELSRQVRDVLARFEALANKLEANFINKEIFRLYSDGVTRELEHISRSLDQQVQAEKERNGDLDKRLAVVEGNLDKRISALEGNITWVVRAVIGAIIIALLAGIGIAAKAKGGG